MGGGVEEGSNGDANLTVPVSTGGRFRADTAGQKGQASGHLSQPLLGLQRRPQLRAKADPEGAAIGGCGLPSSVPQNREQLRKRKSEPSTL